MTSTGASPFQKQSADLLLTNAIVLCMDEAMQIFEPGAVAILGDSLLAVGPAAEMEKSITAQEVVDCGGKVLMPGLINAHTHVPMNLLRGMPKKRSQARFTPR